MTTTTARELAEPVEPIDPEITCAEVFDFLLADGDVLNIPVVDRGRPVGLVNRLDFMLIYVRMYGREIYGRQPITTLMHKAPTIVDAGASCEEATYLSVYLERAARMQIRAQAFGPLTPVDDALAREAHDYLLKPSIVNATFNYWARQTHGIAPLPLPAA